MSAKCPRCEGLGRMTQRSAPCHLCMGRGEVDDLARAKEIVARETAVFRDLTLKALEEHDGQIH